MHILLGGTGHVGSALAQALLKRGEPVTVVSSNPKKSGEWVRQGAVFAVADVHDAQALHAVFKNGKRLFLLNPPANPSTDTAAEERKTLASILKALDKSGIEKVVALSTYGAQPGERIGDLGVLYKMEQELANTSIPFTIIRAAYYMSNWDMALETARQEGRIHTFFPLDFKLPMVSPHDIGQVAARLMTEPPGKTGLHYVEGPQRYSSSDVARAFAVAFGKPVEAIEIPREQWIPALTAAGFSPEAAQSMTAMTAITVENLDLPDAPVRGTTTLQAYVNKLVTKA